ncbi:uncharacterized protein EDB91DRAFT_1255039 [Suillus paluster]|uniref:uncharacterized protein n=1 Tax=Suillus paluster TaxID=48578 RepID=UPI001B8647AB|nr:uncharacterized protein EDB91DRAFT_1255039 [Suillus paluster]KAG1724900.1 hypothetical protein EDB91DRAFT_1255039 [Suillus paluster]
MALTRPKGQAGTNTKSKKTVTPAITHIKQNGLHCTGSSTSVEDETADDTASKLVKKKHKRGDGAMDILTIFKLVDDEDPSQGYVCEPCVELREANPKKHGKLQTIFKGNNTAMRTHIQRMGMSHYCRYYALQQELELLPYCKTRWGSWNGVIAQMLLLKKAVKIFINTTDDSDDVPNVDKHQRKYASYHVSETEWDLLAMIRKVLAAAANVQEAFLAEYYPTIWRILPLYEDFIAQWQIFSEDPGMAVLRHAIQAGIANLEKYYNKTDNSPAHIVSMYLNPCIKDEYFNVAWTEDGQQQALAVMEKVFDKYCRKHATEIATCKDPIPTPELSSSSNSFGSLMSRVTEGRRAREKLVTKDFRAGLKLYIEEPLIVNDEQASPERQAEHIFKWWKANAM